MPTANKTQITPISDINNLSAGYDLSDYYEDAEENVGTNLPLCYMEGTVR